jgi:serine/threonine-protein kinase
LKVLHASASAGAGAAGASAGAGGTGTGAGANSTAGGARILREARAAAGIGHPNAIAIYDVGEVDGVPFLAMEFVSGRTLRTYVRDESVPLPRRIRWLTDVAKALGAAHHLGLVHRDIKPENVMVRDDGVVKVLDFGIARRTAMKADPHAPTDAAAALGTLTADGLVVGTPFYMAPEQMRGEPLDGRADQFSWGVLAHELLTGELPWTRESDSLQLVAQILTREVESLRAKKPEIPPAIDAAVRVALSKAAAHRFATMEELAAELEPHALAGGAWTGRSARRSVPQGDPSLFAPTLTAPAITGGVLEPKNEPSTKTQLASAGSPGASARSGWWKVGVGGALAAALGVASLVFWPASHAPEAKGGGDAASVAPAESQMSANPEATAAYRAGLQALRDASLQPARQQLDRAIQLDADFAAAHLRRALLSVEMNAEVRQDLLAARNGRASLSPHDRALLDAEEPWAFAPSDVREAERRLAAAATQFPNDAELSYQLGVKLPQDDARATEAFDAAIAHDPTYAIAWCMKGRVRSRAGDAAGAVGAYTECLKISPGGTSCLEDLASLQGATGHCEDMASTSRRLIAVAPDVATSYGWLAQALYSLGQPVDAVRGALEQKWDRLAPSQKNASRLSDEASLAALTGQFADADKWNRELEKEDARASSDAAHFLHAYGRMLVAFETGRAPDALALASEYLRRRSAWQADDLAFEPTIYAYALQVQVGAVTPAQFASLRDGWLERDQARAERLGLTSAAVAGTRWSAAYALPATTAEEANAALALLPDVAPLVAAPAPQVDQPIGRTYLLAGRLPEAVITLTRASRACAVLEGEAPLFTTWAALDLGQALEARGDGPGACAAYQQVLERWGGAKASRTAAKARARAQALHCTH